MWTAIFELNKTALLPALDDFAEDLARLREALAGGDATVVRALLEQARSNRADYDGD